MPKRSLVLLFQGSLFLKALSFNSLLNFFILGHLRSIALVFVNYAVKANAESEDSLLLPSIEALMQIIKIVAFHFNAKKEDFFKVLEVENSETSDDVLIALIDCCKGEEISEANYIHVVFKKMYDFRL